MKSEEEEDYQHTPTKMAKQLGRSNTPPKMENQPIYQACKLLGDRVAKFSGLGDRTFEEFLEEFTDLMERFQIPNEYGKIILPLYLVGPAKVKYSNIPGVKDLSWEELVINLAKKFKSDALLSNLRDELHNITQGRDSIAEFAEKIFRKTKFAFQGMDKNLASQMAIDFFIKGLNPQIRKAVRRLPETSDFDTVVASAEKEYRILQQEREEDRETTQTINSIIVDDKIDRLEKELNALKLQIPPNQSRNPIRARGNRGAHRGTSRRPFLNPARNPNSPRGSWSNNRRTFFTRGFRLPFNRSVWRNPMTTSGPYVQGGYPQNLLVANPLASTDYPSTSGLARSPYIATNLLYIAAIVAYLTPFTVAQQYQICGTNPSANVIALPTLVDCAIHHSEPLMRTTAHLYMETNNPLRMNATKCYRDVIKVAITNYLYIRTQREVVQRFRISIPRELCISMRATGQIHGHILKQIVFGLWTTDEIEDDNYTLPLWGTNHYLRSVYSMEHGDLASFDGKHVISSFANLQNCALTDGYCQLQEETVVWEPVSVIPLCPYMFVGSFDVYVNMKYAVIPQHEIAFEFYEDPDQEEEILLTCGLSNHYLTTSRHVLVFPSLPENTSLQEYIRQKQPRKRPTREIRYVIDAQGNKSPYEFVSFITQPLIQRIFGIHELSKLPQFAVNPITEPKILKQIMQWNVTNKDFVNRRRLYAVEDPRMTVLRTIRYAEYRWNQLALFAEIAKKRALTYGEYSLQRDLQHGISPTFDEYLAREFGASKIEFSEGNSTIPIPHFSAAAIPTSTQKPKIMPVTPATKTTKSTTVKKAKTMATLKTNAVKPEQITAKPRSTTTQTHDQTHAGVAITRQSADVPPQKETIELSNSQTQALVNQLAAKFLKRFHEPMFVLREMYNNICTRQYLNTLRIYTLSTIEPTWAARELLGRSDVVATLQNGELLVTRCRSVTPTHIYTDHKINDICYVLTPVQVENETWFSIPGTQDLLPISATTPCPYLSHKRSYHFQHVLLPNSLKLARPFLFGPPIFYAQDSDNALPFARFYLQALQQNLYDNEAKVQKRGVFENVISKIQAAGKSVGHSLRSTYAATTEKLSEGVNEIKWSLLNLALWIIIPVLVSAIIIILCIFYIKLYFIRRTSTAAASAMIDLANTFTRKKPIRRQINTVQTENVELETVSEPLFIPRIYAVLSSKTARLPYVQIILANRPAIALVDSGAAISCIRLSTLLSLQPYPPPTKDNITAVAANGTKISVIATVHLPICLGTYIIDHTIHVVNDGDCPAPVLLGSDFLRRLNEHGLKVTLDLYKQQLTVGDSTHKLVQLNNIMLSENQPYSVRVVGPVTLQGRTNNLIPAKIDGYFSTVPTDFYIEDNHRPFESIFVIGRALVTSDGNGNCFINVLNPTVTCIQLYDRMNIARAVPAVSADLQISALQQIVPYVPPEADWEQWMPKFPMTPIPDHDITAEIDFSRCALDHLAKEKLKNLIRTHSNAFVGPDGSLGHYNGPIRHRIDLIEGSEIPARKVYRVPLEKRMEIEKQITQMLKDGIIRESTSPFCAPIVLVRKRDANSWRFTIDFRGLNAITKPQQSILPNIQDILDLCANQCLYTSLDFQQGFHQIPLEESHCERTAFACFLGAFEYVRMPMGLKGAPATFQRIMEDFKKYLRARVFIYIDDLIITSETPEEHLRDIDEVLGKIEVIGMKLKASKCEFARDEITFLGFVLSKDGIRPNPEKTKAIDQYPIPKTASDVRAFLGMCSFFRRFVYNFASVAAPLFALTKKDAKFEWTKECQQAMDKLKGALTTAPILVAPRLGLPFVIETDSSAKGVAAVLRQEQEGELKVIAYASRTLNKHEARYPAIELEALGLVFAVQKFRPYIDGAKCTIITDHSPLKALFYRKDLTGRLAKYQIVLQEFDITIVYRAGKKNVLCDTLSRHLPEVNSIQYPGSQGSDQLDLTVARAEQDNCPWIANYKQRLKENSGLPELADYIIYDEILYKIPHQLNQELQLVLPEDSTLKNRILAQVHCSNHGSAHLGTKKTLAAIAKIAIWNKMQKDVNDYVTSCKVCQIRKDPEAYRVSEPLHRFEIPTRPWQRVHSDVIGPLPLTLQGNKFIIVFVDAFSKFIIAEPIPDQKANTTTDTFINRCIARFGTPEVLVTDQGTNYMSDTFRRTLNILNITHKTSTPYHHESNGQVERANRTLQEMISMATSDHPDNWDNIVHLITHAYNSAKNSSTQHSPHSVIHGLEPNDPFRMALRLPMKKFVDADDYADQLIALLQNIWQNVAHNLKKSQDTQKRHYDLRKKTHPTEFIIGGKVMIRKATGHKLAPRFEGPFEIVDVDRPNITIRDGRRLREIHMDRAKIWKETANSETDNTIETRND
ncbi:integrase core domain protein [Oesophagostomum dentatum]|uniref:RNA-directed DNA polymerase n=1 Tax=Oesophagostomum dentatum TaxID=61180 RepID=A0A0B1SZQ6_OESDE|nr:integrase core domain protein [Oesophagostomum dentatum]